MNLIISFSARENGNCDAIASYIKSGNDRVVYFRNLNFHPCISCHYECFQTQCRYREDSIYNLYAGIRNYEKVILIVPMYCGNPCSMYFAFNERSQDYFMHNNNYDDILRRLYIIGIYGSENETPDFIPCLEKWFACSPVRGHVMGIQRHRFCQKMEDSILDIPEVREQLHLFLK